MTYATLMVYVDNAEGAADRVAFARDLAGKTKSSLTGIAALMPQAPPVDPYSSSMLTSEIMDLEKAAAEAVIEEAKSIFTKATASWAGYSEWRSGLDMPSDFIAREARNADLVVLGEDQPVNSRFSAAWAGEVIMKAGRPVLVVPSPCPPIAAFDNILIAWKDTRATRLAVTLAMPLLKTARKVTVVEITDEADDPQAVNHLSDVAQWLGRHGIQTQTLTQTATSASIASQIVDVAVKENCGLIVMGGYGHSRLREWVFGGATSDILKSCPIPRLLAH